jgi:hypothetical protein
MEGKVELAGTSNVSLHGVFRIHGASHEISVPVQVNAHDGKLEAHIKFAVPFVEWGMKDPSTLFLKVNKQVDIDLGTTGTLLSATSRLENSVR